jgi:DNA gyrase subunit A
VPFHSAARRRYLNYAISVITSRALPDVRDGLKPVQRRILYTMQNDLHLSAGAKPLKCARIVGDVLGKYHPHGDSAVYDALVRMAQDFSLRYPLVDGHGNFGSLDGDSAAAYRYTEARLQPVSMALLGELTQETVDFRPNYDGRTEEPTVLPAKVPLLLVNGATGIAVGMATNIPPHNLGEVAQACEALIESRDLSVASLMKYIKGPDFPTGGQILNSREEIRQIYEEGQGAIRVRAEYKTESGQRLIITSIPYMVQKDALVRSIGELVYARKLPHLLDVRDESTSDVRIVCELKKNVDPAVVMAYLYKHTQLQTSFSSNLTCLVPTKNGGPSAPARVDLKVMLSHFIEFRYEVVERRFRHELRLLQERIHILQAFKKIFNALDEAIRIIRGADGRPDAATKLRKHFKLDDVAAQAILDLRLYKLSKLEIRAILDELRKKRARVLEIEGILKSSRKLWKVVKTEIRETRQKFGDARRTKVVGRGVEETEYDEEAYIVDEDAYILLSRDGWMKRVGRVGDLSKVRLRPDDKLLAVVGGNTRHSVSFFSNYGSVYTIRINEIPPTRGYGEPIQRFFKFRDGERVVGAVSFDPRVLSKIGSARDREGTIPKNHAFAVNSGGYAIRFSLYPFSEVSTRTGRKFTRLKEGEEVVSFHVVDGKENIILATRNGRVIIFVAAEVKFLSGPGRGVLAIKLDKKDKDRVIGCAASREKKEGLRVYTTGGRKVDVNPRRYRVTSRAGKGVEVIKRGGLSRVDVAEVTLPDLGEGTSATSRRPAARGRPMS